MQLTALGLWIATAMGGLYMFGLLFRSGNTDSRAQDSHLPTFAVFTHGFLALVGLTAWAVYMMSRQTPLGWSVFGLILVVAAGGGLLFLRWTVDRHRMPAEKRQLLAEQQIPSPIVHLHGALATLTVVAVLLTMLDLG
jgi:hypothetical protein